MHRDEKSFSQGEKYIICKIVSSYTKKMRIFQLSQQFIHTNLVRDGNVLHVQNYLAAIDLT